MSNVGKHLLNHITAGIYYIFSLSNHINSCDSSISTLDVSTLYKKKPDKIKLVDLLYEGGLKPEERENW